MFSIVNRLQEPQRKFNREKVLLAAMQSPAQIYEMMDTRYDGLYRIEADERRREFGSNVVKLSRMRMRAKMSKLSRLEFDELFEDMDSQRTTVFYSDSTLHHDRSGRDLVPGDVLQLTAGEIVPADVRIVDEKDLMVNQYFVSNQKDVVKKSVDLDEEFGMVFSVTGLPNICFMGSMIVVGKARAVVIGTGSETYLSYKYNS